MDTPSTRGTVGFRCPACSMTTLSGADVTRVPGDLLKLRCPCGESEAVIEKTAAHVALTVPCFACKSVHRFPLAPQVIEIERALRLSCPNTGLAIAYVGERAAIVAAAREDDEGIREAIDDAGEEGDALRRALFTPPQTSEESAREEEYARFAGHRELSRAVLADLSDEGRICCDCGKTDLSALDVELEGGVLRVTCPRCRRSAHLPLATSRDEEALLNLGELILRE